MSILQRKKIKSCLLQMLFYVIFFHFHFVQEKEKCADFLQAQLEKVWKSISVLKKIKADHVQSCSPCFDASQLSCPQRSISGEAPQPCSKLVNSPSLQALSSTCHGPALLKEEPGSFGKLSRVSALYIPNPHMQIILELPHLSSVKILQQHCAGRSGVQSSKRQIMFLL